MPLRIQSPTVFTQPLPTGPSHQYTTYAYLQACLMENTGQTDINSQTISRCTQITAPRPDTALACAANPDADICGVEDVEGLIELEASEAPGQVRVFS